MGSMFRLGLLFPVISLSQFFEPLTLSFKSFQEEAIFPSEAFERALSQDGLVAVRDIPGFDELKRIVVRSADQCKTSRANATFNDGTLRYSLAAASNETTRGIFNVRPDECPEFEKYNTQFRDIVTRSLDSFTSKVSQSFKPSEPLLTVGSRVLHTVAELIKSADVLEQFHSFVPSDHASTRSELTLEWHTDGGLLLVFTPAQMEDLSAGGFMIRKEGVAQEVKFDPSVDLVFMFGDGVQRLVNPKLPTRLSSTVHALKTPTSRRWWYGRMMLPPGDALHTSGLTYREVRNRVISSSYDEVLEMGCSSTLLRPLAVGARALLQNCAVNQTLCWAVCTDIPTKILNDCAALGQTPQCNDHGDGFYPCVNKTFAPSSPPTVAQPTHTARRSSASSEENVGTDLAIAFGVLGAILLGTGMYVCKHRRSKLRVTPEETADTEMS